MSAGGPQMHLAGIAVDDDRVARLGQRHDVVELADGGDAERARDDRDVAGRPDLLEHQPAQPLAVVVEKLRRAHVARDDDRRRPAGRAAKGPCGRPISSRSSRLARSSKSCSRSRRNGSVCRAICARVSFCTRSTAASAVRPFRIASCSRRVQPRSSANIL